MKSRFSVEGIEFSYDSANPHYLIITVDNGEVKVMDMDDGEELSNWIDFVRFADLGMIKD